MIWLLLVSSLLAQKPLPKASGGKVAPPRVLVKDSGAGMMQVRSLRVKGNQNFTAADIVEFSGLRVGQTVDADQLEAARVKLANSGVFERVGYQYAPAAGGGIEVVLEVVEIAQVFPYRFEELPATRAEMIAYLKKSDTLFSEQIPATKEFLSRYSRTLEEFLKPKGLKEAVMSKLVPEAGNKLVVIFRPDRPIPTISQVSFKGNEAVPTPVLQLAMNQIAMGANYTGEIVKQYLETTIRPIYEQRGRLDVAFTKITATPSADNSGMNLVIELVEGASYDIGKITLRGAVGDPKELYKIMVLQPGDLANMTEVSAGLKRVQSHLVREGYIKAAVKVDRKLHREKDKSLADLDVNVTPGPFYRFGKLTIDGLDILTEPQIRKMWGMETGKAYNGEYPQLFLDRLREENLFENLGSTKAFPSIDEQTHVVDVKLVFGAAVKEKAKKRPF